MTKAFAQRYAELAIHQRFLTLSQRERVLTLLAIAVVIIFAGYVLFIEPITDKNTQIRQDIAAKTTQLQAQQRQLRRLQEELKADPDQLLAARSTRLTAQLDKLDHKFATELRDLVPARQMPMMLKTVLARAKGLRLIEMKSIPPVDILFATEQAEPHNQLSTSSQQSSAQEAAKLYQHGVLLVLEGDYFAVQNYLSALESLDWRFYWQRFDYRVQNHPNARVEIELFTLSTNKAFIGV